ncbi:uncharacterized protein LOC142802921 [Rhipicephalus microplus]|uniref:uncharacterized protein LOC142802921 n=1 Tax=Rhipicephalus microplus TaxID=6941 RepID=UPI003F6B7DDF
MLQDAFLPQTAELVKWMNVMNLDFLNKTRLQSVDPVEMMVRGSLDLGVYVTISIIVSGKRFDYGRRVVEMKYSNEQESWLKRRSQQPAWMNTDYYVRLFLMYGIPFEEVYPYAEKILAYEEQLRQIEKETANVTQNEFVRIYGLGRRTDPYVTAIHGSPSCTMLQAYSYGDDPEE